MKVHVKEKNIMSWLAAGLLLLSFFLTAACASVNIPVPESDDDTLLVIPSWGDFSRLGGASERAFSFLNLKIDGTGKEVNVRSTSIVSLIRGLKPGVYSAETLTEVLDTPPNWKYSGELPKPEPLYVTFEVKPKQITIFPVKFIYVTDTTTTGYSHIWRREKITAEDKKSILSYLEEHENFSLWSNGAEEWGDK